MDSWIFTWTPVRKAWNIKEKIMTDTNEDTDALDTCPEEPEEVVIEFDFTKGDEDE